MFEKLRRLRREYHELRRYQAEHTNPRIVFYAEDEGSWPHFAPIVEALTGETRQVAYVISSPADHALRQEHPGMRVYCIGSGAARIAFFESLRDALVVMTMPDLGTYHIKRSRLPRVHYVYVHHSMVSTHMIYRTGAFDHFDTIFCVGPHHVAETRASEKRYRLPAKNLIEHGYGRLDHILRCQRLPMRAGGYSPHVLLAPSWGDQAILESIGAQTVAALREAGYRVTVRPHPRTRLRHARAIDDLVRRFDGDPGFALEEDATSFASLLSTDLMVSDWSGVALEYAFGAGKPVLFLDVPRKVNNPRYTDLGIEPVEVRLREQLGAVVSPGDPAGMRRVAARLIAEAGELAQELPKLREATVFNVGRSGESGARALAELFDRQFA
jgi:hypothetical protein